MAKTFQLVYFFSIYLKLLFLSRSVAYQLVSDDTLKSLPRPNGAFDIYKGAILSPILQPRVPGTPGSTAVLNHIVNFFQNELHDWTIEFQNSTSKTPVTGDKNVPFVNFIASRDPPWAATGDVGRLTLAAHYDSKYEPKGFIGAVDSAAPCAIIMHVMQCIDAALTSKWSAMDADGHNSASLDEYRGIQVMFLDGEEAFLQWTATDSLYGSRSLAEEWDTRVNAAMSTFKTPLSSIMLFVLLDLLGSKDPTIHSYFLTTHWAYKSIASLEKRMRGLKLFKSSPNLRSKEHANPDSTRAEERLWLIDAMKDGLSIHGGMIDDDHTPFLHRGVEVLHLIDFSPLTGFPNVWHTLEDDGEHLDMNTVEDWSVLITAFAAEWMELEGFLGSTTARSDDNNPEPEPAKWKRKTELI